MLNRAARYFPILREVGQLVESQDGCRVLEIGSGSIGLGEFWSHQFVGCDICFPVRPRAPMCAVRCSAAQLPFADQSFDVVVASDVVEHVPPDSRKIVISEALRVARGAAVFGYPCGPDAWALDRKLHAQYVSRSMTVPGWLEEHMTHSFPDDGLLSEAPAGWKVKAIPNEKLNFHYRMMQLEMYRPLDYLFRLALLVVPGMVERFLRRMDGKPSYRRIFVLTRQGT